MTKPFDGLRLDYNDRLAAIERSGLLSLKDDPALDQMTSLICEALGVPVALVSIVTDARQVFSSAKGLPVPWDARGETPLSHSFCQHVVTSGLPLQVNDAPSHDLVGDNLAIRDLGVQAYLGTPLRDPDGVVLGSLCAIDTSPRDWTPRELKVLEGFASSITTLLLAWRTHDALVASDIRSSRHEARLLRVTNSTPVMIAELDTDLKYAFANKAYAKLVGHTPETIIGLNQREALGASAFALSEPHLQQALTGKTVDYDLELPSPNTSTRTFRVHCVAERDENDAVDGIVVAVTDVTEQRLLSSLADKLDDRLKAAHQMSPDGFMVFKSLRNGDGDIVDFEWEYINEPGAEIAGHPIDELIGNTLLKVLPGNKDEGLFDAYVDVVTTGQPYRKTSFYDQDGLTLWISISAIKLGDGFAVSFSDVTERKSTEIATAKNADRLQRILDNVVAFVGVMSPEGILREVNQPALDIAGLARADVVGKPFWDAYWWSFSPESQARLIEAFEDAKKGKASRYDALIRTGEDQKIWIDFQLSPQMDANGKLVEMIPSGTDISERKRAEAHRELLVNELNHRVKNSLATIQAMARQTIRGAADLKDFETTFTARLAAISTAHEILVNSEGAKADLRTMIDRQVGPYVDGENQLRISGSAVTLAAECAHSVGLVMHELATNAAKYGALSCSDGHVEILSRDTGDGNVTIIWSEHNGPAVTPPENTGFGSKLINQSIEFSLGGSADVDYAPEGVKVTLIVPKEFDHG